MMFVLIALFDNGADARTRHLHRRPTRWSRCPGRRTRCRSRPRTRISELTHDYATTVANTEWPLPAAHATPTDDTSLTTLTELRQAIDATTTTTDWQEDRRIEAADAAWDVYQARQARLDAAGGGVNAVVWFALLASGLATVVLTYLFDALPRPPTWSRPRWWPARSRWCCSRSSSCRTRSPATRPSAGRLRRGAHTAHVSGLAARYRSPRFSTARGFVSRWPAHAGFSSPRRKA